MKKLTLITTICALSVNFCIAQTSVPAGNVSGTWTFANSPYIINGDITIPNASTLTIESGVNVKFNGSYQMIVNGTLVAIGTEDSMILFTGNKFIPTNSDWAGISFTDSSEDYDSNSQKGSIMQYCIVQHAAGDNNNYLNPSVAVINISSAAPFIDNCIIKDNDASGEGILKISSGNEKLKITNNHFINNTTHTHGYLATISGSNVEISNNLFYNNISWGINFIMLMGGCEFFKNIIANNQTMGNIFDVYEGAKLTKNTIADNEPNLFTYTFSILACSDTLIYNTIITRNNTDDRLRLTLIRNLLITAQYSNNNFFSDNNNLSYFTILQNKIVRQQYNSPVLDAKNNWWGTTSSTEIEELIFDYIDDSTNCKVDYSSFQTSPDTIAPVTPPINVSKTDIGNGEIQVTWSHNLEADLMGYKIYYGSPTGYSFENSIDVGNDTSYILSGINMIDTIAVTAYDTQMDGIKDQYEGHESWFTYDYFYYQTGIEPKKDIQNILHLYPNPTTGEFTIEIQNPSFIINNSQLIISNMLGQTIYQQTLNSKQETLNLSTSPKGIYTLQLISEEGIINKKIVVQ